MLSGLAIAAEVFKNTIVITDFNYGQLNPNSYDLRLNDKMLIYNEAVLDVRKDNLTTEIEIDNQLGFILQPGKIYLASTMEYTETHKHVPCVEGKSSLGRLGLDVHATAGFGDIGFCGCWTLELSVKQPLKIYPWIRICQIAYHSIEGEYVKYSGKYQGDKGVGASKSYRDFTKKD